MYELPDATKPGCRYVITEEMIESDSKPTLKTASAANGKVKLVLPDGVDIKHLYAIAAEQSVQLIRLNYKRDSLEDIFLKAMGDANGRL